jgi:hypothetical protein
MWQRSEACVVITAGRALRTVTCALVIALSAMTWAAVAGASPLSWSPPTVIDHHPPFATPATFTGVSCASSMMCAATDGAIEVSTHPRGDYTAWRQPAISGSHGNTTAISCPSASVCVAVDDAGHVITSNNPFGSGAWTSLDADAANALSSVSCPSASLCIAVDQAGRILHSTHPTGGPGAWTAVTVDAAHRLLAVSCPSSDLCVALDSAGNFLTSAHPTSGAGAWSSARVDPFEPAGNGNQLATVSCPSSTLCVAADYAGNIFSSTNPRGGVAAWHAVHAFDGSPSFLPAPSISCPSVSLCVLVSFTSVIRSSNPTGGAGAWSGVHLADQGFLSAISCPTTGFCLAVDQPNSAFGFPTFYVGGDTVTSTDPLGPGSAWTVRQVAGSNGAVSVSCTQSTFCVVGNDAGSVLSSSHPGGGASAWSYAHIDPNGAQGGPGPTAPAALTTVGCHSASACVGGDDAGDLMSSAHVAGGAAGWSFFNAVGDYFEVFTGSSCPALNECLVVGTLGALAVIDPASTSRPTLARIDPARGLLGISCPSIALCVATDFNGNVLSSTNPTGGPSAWRTVAISSAPLTGIACPTASLCVAVNANGQVFSSTHPTGDTAAWVPATIDPSHALTAVSCASAAMCIATDDGGNVLSATHPTGGSSAWSATQIDPASGLFAISCSPALTCVAVDGAGAVLVGVPSRGASAAARVGRSRWQGRPGIRRVPPRRARVAGLAVGGRRTGLQARALLARARSAAVSGGVAIPGG